MYNPSETILNQSHLSHPMLMMFSWKLAAKMQGTMALFATPTTQVYKRPQGSRAVHILQAKAFFSSTS
jgi:hypothetical protein